MIIRKRLYSSRNLVTGLFLGIISVLKSFFKRQYGFEKSITINYPLDQYHYSEKLFGMPELVYDENDKSLCTSCNLCIEICPTNCLNLIGDDGKAPKEFSIDVGSCIFCAYCEYVCPEQAIVMGKKHILSLHKEEPTIFTIKDWKEFSQK